MGKAVELIISSVFRKINQQYVYGDIAQIEALQEAQLQVYTPNTKFWWRLAELVYASAYERHQGPNFAVVVNPACCLSACQLVYSASFCCA
jgi:hypothetical protein